MKMVYVLIFVVVISASLVFVSTRYEVLEPGSVMVIANDAGSPEILLSDGGYFVRDWEVEKGCYQLTKIRLINFNFALKTSDNHCE